MSTYYQKYRKYQQRYYQLAGASLDDTLTKLNSLCGNFRNISPAKRKREFKFHLLPSLVHIGDDSINQILQTITPAVLQSEAQSHKLCVNLIQTLQGLQSGVRPIRMSNLRRLRSPVEDYIHDVLFPQLIYQRETDSDSSLGDQERESIGTPTNKVLSKIFDYLGFMYNLAKRPGVLDDAPLDQTSLPEPNVLMSVFVITPMESRILGNFTEEITAEFGAHDKRRHLVSLLDRYLKKHRPRDTTAPTFNTIPVGSFDMRQVTNSNSWSATSPISANVPSVRVIQGLRLAIKQWTDSGSPEFTVPQIRVLEDTPETQLLQTGSDIPGLSNTRWNLGSA